MSADDSAGGSDVSRAGTAPGNPHGAVKATAADGCGTRPADDAADDERLPADVRIGDIGIYRHVLDFRCAVGVLHGADQSADRAAHAAAQGEGDVAFRAPHGQIPDGGGACEGVKEQTDAGIVRGIHAEAGNAVSVSVQNPGKGGSAEHRGLQGSAAQVHVGGKDIAAGHVRADLPDHAVRLPQNTVFGPVRRAINAAVRIAGKRDRFLPPDTVNCGGGQGGGEQQTRAQQSGKKLLQFHVNIFAPLQSPRGGSRSWRSPPAGCPGTFPARS